MTANLPFIIRKKFVHVFQDGRRVILSVDKTARNIRFIFEWFPRFKSRKELEPMAQEWKVWRDHWLGGELGPRHNIQDFCFYKACDSEVSNLIETLPP